MSYETIVKELHSLHELELPAIHFSNADRTIAALSGDIAGLVKSEFRNGTKLASLREAVNDLSIGYGSQLAFCNDVAAYADFPSFDSNSDPMVSLVQYGVASLYLSGSRILADRFSNPHQPINEGVFSASAMHYEDMFWVKFACLTEGVTGDFNRDKLDKLMEVWEALHKKRANHDALFENAIKEFEKQECSLTCLLVG
ncbi:hypothetical protein J4212_04970 [Candidatus Woesearchaeota archaeon]|nr:hypothetical protein [Candidatus Woesearchaeota archaeon]